MKRFYPWIKFLSFKSHPWKKLWITLLSVGVIHGWKVQIKTTDDAHGRSHYKIHRCEVQLAHIYWLIALNFYFSPLSLFFGLIKCTWWRKKNICDVGTTENGLCLFKKNDRNTLFEVHLANESFKHTCYWLLSF